MSAIPLCLTLQPRLAVRTPAPGGSFEFGFHLRLVDGPVMRFNDPLLRAFGAACIAVDSADDDHESLQGDEFDPGRRLVIERVPGEDDEQTFSVWDADGVRRAGTLGEEDPDVATLVAADEHGLKLEAFSLSEFRGCGDDRRNALLTFVYCPDRVSLEVPVDLAVDRPRRPKRARIVLLADGTDVRFWDPAGISGPADFEELPLSPGLIGELKRVRDGYARLPREFDEAAIPFERMEQDWVRDELDQRVTCLWRRTREELGRPFTVGFQGPGMDKPVWSLQELCGPTGDPSADIPF